MVGDPSATVQFTDASTDPDGHVVEWSWDFGDGTTGSGSSPAHAYTQAGDYTVILTVTDEDGLTSQAYGSVSISSA
jgi:PKD repeat protein